MPERGSVPEDNLKYVLDMLEQLKPLALVGGGAFLVYLIDMARGEAADCLRELGETSASAEKRDPAA